MFNDLNRQRLAFGIFIAIFASACGNVSRPDRGIRPLPNEIVLTIENHNLFEVELRPVNRYCDPASAGRIFRLQSNEKRSYRLKETDFNLTAFAFLARIRIASGLDPRTEGCSGAAPSPPSGSAVYFNIPSDLYTISANVPIVIRPPR